MTVEELIAALGEMPADAPVCLATRHGGEAEEFDVVLSDDWVVLDG